MDKTKAAAQLKYQLRAINSLVMDLTTAEALWKPNPESWSVLEVINHLVDEEVLDFRCHLKHILHNPEQTWPKIDPVGWVIEKQYNQRQLEPSLLDFKAEREKSIAWLQALPHPNWNSAVILPWGSLTAGDMLASWLAHDLLHLRQLVALRYSLTSDDCHPHSVDYAGDW